MSLGSCYALLKCMIIERLQNKAILNPNWVKTLGMHVTPSKYWNPARSRKDVPIRLISLWFFRMYFKQVFDAGYFCIQWPQTISVKEIHLISDLLPPVPGCWHAGSLTGRANSGGNPAECPNHLACLFSTSSCNWASSGNPTERDFQLSKNYSAHLALLSILNEKPQRCWRRHYKSWAGQCQFPQETRVSSGTAGRPMLI